MECPGHIGHVRRIKSSNGYPTISCHIDVMLLGQLLDLVLIKSSIGKHSDLICDMAPILLASENFELRN